MSHRNLLLYQWFNFLLGLSFFAPVAIIYYAQVSGSYTLGSSILAIIMLSSAAFELPTGILSDMLGRKHTLVIGSFLAVLSLISYAVGHHYLWLVLGATLEGLSRSFYSGNNDAFLYEVASDQGRADHYDDYLGKARSLEHLGIALGAVIGGILANYSLTLAVSLTLLPLSLAFITTLFMSEPRSHERGQSNIYAHTREAISLFIHNKKLRLLSIADAISFSTGEASYQFRASFFATIWPVWAIGLLNTTLQFGASLSYYLSSWMIKSLGAEKLLLIRSIIGKMSGLIAFGFSSLYSPLITIIPSFLYGAGQVAKNTLMQREFTSHQRATMSSLNALLSNLAYAVMSLLLGLVADLATPQTALLGITLLSFPVVGVYWHLFNKPTPTT